MFPSHDQGGSFICADTPVCSASAGTTPFSVEACDPNCATDPDCDTTILYDWRLCSVAWDDASDAGYCDSAGLPTFGGLPALGNATEEGIVYQAKGTSGDNICINIRLRDGYTPEPGVNQTATTVLNMTTVFSSNVANNPSEADCVCCGTYKYEICDSACATCSGILPTLYINPSEFATPASPPSILAAYDSSADGGSGCGCCYELANGFNLEYQCEQTFSDGSSQSIMSNLPQTAGITSGIITLSFGVVDCTSASCTAAPRS